MRKEQNTLVIFGVNAVLEKLKSSPQEVFEVMVLKGHQRSALRAIAEKAERQGLSVRYVEPEQLNSLSNGRRHQGVVAKIAAFCYRSFADLIQELSPSPEHEWILVLDGLTDPRNFGALLRCAEGVGIRHVVIPQDRSVGVTQAVVKSSAGAVHYLKIHRVVNLRRAILALKERGYWIVGLDAAAPESAYDKVYPEKVVVVLGSEGAGIRPLIRRECDFLVSIPMRGKIDSLNVAVAGGILLYELMRQRRLR
jgi:23S rRNA (guanosine2251-2'-O)-methyltransferase